MTGSYIFPPWAASGRPGILSQTSTCISMLDIRGTLRGNWFIDDIDIARDWDKQLAFIFDPHDPSISIISIGGVFTDAGTWEFSANSTGFINRKFEDVSPDGHTYCYEAEGQSGRIIVELTSATELRIEQQGKTCAESYGFISPTVYNR